MDKNTTRHSERSEESRHYVRNSFGKLAYGKGLIWILRSLTLPQNDGQWEISITKKIAFTMAEILLSLTIIGVVAAITLPSLTGNINEKTWNTQRKALYARMSQAISLLPYVSGYGIGDTNSQTKSLATKTFVNEGLGKVLKINNICDNNNFSKCGFASTYKAMDGTTKSFPRDNYSLHNYLATHSSYHSSDDAGNSWGDSYSLTNMDAIAFETKNGESVIAFYQPFCQNSKITDARWQYFFVSPYMCANFIYDLNGKKGPNTVGKDIGYMSVFYATNSVVVMPQPAPADTKSSGQAYTNSSSAPILSSCKSADNEYRLPNIEELASMMINSDLNGMDKMKNSTQSKFYVATRLPKNRPWVAVMAHNAWSTLSYGNSYYVRCVKH